MINALLSRGERMQSIHDRDCEWLRKKAYKEICIEKSIKAIYLMKLENSQNVLQAVIRLTDGRL